jgi:DNA adenine methylase
MNLWDMIINRPEEIADAYEHLWYDQLGRERDYYDHVRECHNQTQRPDYFLYLLARCVKGAIRYNGRGEFNRSPDNRRKGMHPATMRAHILNALRLLHGRTEVYSLDYRDAAASAALQDVIYLDPPYQGVCRDRDPRYIRSVSFQEFIAFLLDLNRKRLSYIVSYDGRTEDKTYGAPLPDSLELIRLEINAGRSTQATLLGKVARTFESLYVSPALTARLDKPVLQSTGRGQSPHPCLELFA